MVWRFRQILALVAERKVAYADAIEIWRHNLEFAEQTPLPPRRVAASLLGLAGVLWDETAASAAQRTEARALATRAATMSGEEVEGVAASARGWLAEHPALAVATN